MKEVSSSRGVRSTSGMSSIGIEVRLMSMNSEGSLRMSSSCADMAVFVQQPIFTSEDLLLEVVRALRLSVAFAAIGGCSWVEVR